MFCRATAIKKFYKILSVIICFFWVSFISCYVFKCAERAFVYPLKYKETVFERADKYGLESALVFAIIKIESGFDANAESNKGAKGLMQITPATAEYVSAISGISEYDLFIPDDNVELGCFYLKYLLNKFGVCETAVAAYNAGEGNVVRWLEKNEYSDDNKNLTNIPFPETREYIKKFRKSFEKYKKLYVHILDK